MGDIHSTLHSSQCVINQLFFKISDSLLSKNTCDLETSLEALTLTQESLQKKIKQLVTKIEKYDEEILYYADSNKHKALKIFRMKKLYQVELERVENMYYTIERQILQIESSHVTHATLNTLRPVIGELKNMHKQFNVDNISNLMDSMEEQNDNVQEITDMFLTTNKSLTEYTEEELLEDFDALVEKKKQVVFPSVPTDPPKPPQPPFGIKTELSVNENRKLEQVLN